MSTPTSPLPRPAGAGPPGSAAAQRLPRAFRSITTRWADNDVYGHVNNVVYWQLVRHRRERPFD